MAAERCEPSGPHTCAPVAFLISGICKDGRCHEALVPGPPTGRSAWASPLGCPATHRRWLDTHLRQVHAREGVHRGRQLGQQSVHL